MTAATQKVYLERLEKLTFDEMTCAAQATIEEWGEAHKMPPLVFILERAGRARDRELAERSRKLLNRGDKPAGWEPVDPEELKKFTNDVIATAKAKAMPSYREEAEKNVAAMNGRSELPSDPVLKKQWAHEMAVKNGLATSSREPGAEG